MTIDWTLAEIFESTSHGTLWVFVRKCGRKGLMQRIRRNGHGLYADDKKWFMVRDELQVGEFAFVTKEGHVCRLRPEESLAKHIKEKLL